MIYLQCSLGFFIRVFTISSIPSGQLLSFLCLFIVRLREHSANKPLLIFLSNYCCDLRPFFSSVFAVSAEPRGARENPTAPWGSPAPAPAPVSDPAPAPLSLPLAAVLPPQRALELPGHLLPSGAPGTCSGTSLVLSPLHRVSPAWVSPAGASPAQGRWLGAFPTSAGQKFPDLGYQGVFQLFLFPQQTHPRVAQCWKEVHIVWHILLSR